MLKELKIRYFVPFNGLMGKTESVKMEGGTKREENLTRPNRLAL